MFTDVFRRTVKQKLRRLKTLTCCRRKSLHSGSSKDTSDVYRPIKQGKSYPIVHRSPFLKNKQSGQSNASSKLLAPTSDRSRDERDRSSSSYVRSPVSSSANHRAVANRFHQSDTDILDVNYVHSAAAVDAMNVKYVTEQSACAAKSKPYEHIKMNCLEARVHGKVT